MARIRTVKPEFWDSPDTARASAVARLAYIGMWNWADDAGRGTANLKELEGFIFPNDDVAELSGGKSRNFLHVMQEVAECFGVVFYTVSGRPFYAIPSWDRHQRKERHAAGKYPGPEAADVELKPTPTSGAAENPGTSDDFRHDEADLPTSSGLGTGEQGNRGTGDSATRANLPVAAEPTAQTLVKEWIDNCQERPPGNVVGQVSKQVGTLLKQDQIPYAVVREALQRWQQKGLHPSTLPSVVHEIRNSSPPTSRRQQETDDLFARAAARNGVNLEVPR